MVRPRSPRGGRLLRALLSCALLAGAGCDIGDDEPERPPIVHVTIENLPNPFTTTLSSVWLDLGIGWAGGCHAEGFTGTWSNAASGETGPLGFQVEESCIPFFFCTCGVVGWGTVPVLVGNNQVTVTVNAPNGGVGHDSILVVRNAI